MGTKVIGLRADSQQDVCSYKTENEFICVKEVESSVDCSSTDVSRFSLCFVYELWYTVNRLRDERFHEVRTLIFSMKPAMSCVH